MSLPSPGCSSSSLPPDFPSRLGAPETPGPGACPQACCADTPHCRRALGTRENRRLDPSPCRAPTGSKLGASMQSSPPIRGEPKACRARCAAASLWRGTAPRPSPVLPVDLAPSAATRPGPSDLALARGSALRDRETYRAARGRGARRRAPSSCRDWPLFARARRDGAISDCATWFSGLPAPQRVSVESSVRRRWTSIRRRILRAARRRLRALRR